MAYITDKEQAKQAIQNAVQKGVSIAIFCTGSFWNVESILRAADKFAADHHITDIPVAVAMTSHYAFMEQTRRVTRSGNQRIGLQARRSITADCCATAITHHTGTFVCCLTWIMRTQ